MTIFELYIHENIKNKSTLNCAFGPRNKEDHKKTARLTLQKDLT